MSRLRQRLLTIVLATARSTVRRPPRGDSSVRRILVAHWLLLGDTVLLAPLLAKLAALYPNAERFVLARPSVAPLFSGHPYGFKAIGYDPRDFDSFRNVIAAGPFDIAYVLGDNRYSWLARAAGAHWIIGFSNDTPRWKNWMVDVQMPIPGQACAWADMAAQLAPGSAPEPYRTGDWPAPGGPHTDIPSASYAVLHVGASTSLKHWPVERWRSLAEWLESHDVLPVWSAGPGEALLVDAIDPEHRHKRYCGSLSLAQLWQLLAGAKILICPDTGVAHLGRLVGTPTVALFGPGSVQIYGKGCFWRDSEYIGVTVERFPCRDQNLLFRRHVNWVRRCGRSPSACPTPGACMAAISIDAVKQAALLLMQRTQQTDEETP